MYQLIILSILLISTTPVFSQNSCFKRAYYNPNKAFQVSTESGGLYHNSYITEANRFQIETNFSLGRQKIEGVQQSILLSASQMRYGLSENLELFGGFSVLRNPGAEKLYPEYYSGLAGLKFRLLKYEGRQIQFGFSLKAGYLYLQANVDEQNSSPHGYLGLAAGSIRIVNYAHIDLSYGKMHYPPENSLQDIISGQITLKNDESMVGIFIADHKNLYINSMFDIGFIFTDNKRFISHIAFGMIDTIGALNLSFSYKL